MTAVRRTRRTREDLRQELVEAALGEFAAKGFDGASTRAIAAAVDAYQPQINYHFESKEALFDAAVDHLFGLLIESLGELPPLEVLDDPDELGTVVAELLRGFVRFAALHPELNRIVVQEATEDTPRLRRMVEHHVRPWYEAITAAWTRLRTAGIAAPIDPSSVHWVITGAASIPFVNAPEVRLLAGTDPIAPAWVEAHADAVVAMLLPGLPKARTGGSRRRRASSS